MFKENFIRLCNSRDVAPCAVCQAVGINKSAFSQWTDTTVPRRTTLLKLADYLGVTPDELLADTSAPAPILSPGTSPALTPAELNLLTAYRTDASLRAAIDAMLEATGHAPSTKERASSV